MTEDLDNLLAGHHLLDVAVDCSEVLLLLNEVLARKSRHLLGDQDHDTDKEDRQEREPAVQEDHADKHADDRDDTVYELRDTHAHHLPEGVDVVRVHGHDVAVRMRVEVPDGQALHVLKHPVADALHRALCQEYLHELLKVSSKETAREDERNSEDIGRKRLGKRSAPVQSRSDVFVYKRLCKEHSLNRRLYGQEDADRDKDPLEHVALKYQLHEPQEDLPGVLDRGLNASRHSVHRSRHQSFPLSSKSASAPVCDS